jgi:hypothetical protein
MRRLSLSDWLFIAVIVVVAVMVIIFFAEQQASILSTMPGRI